MGAIGPSSGARRLRQARWNPINNPDRIQVGDVINLTDPGVDFEYTVVEGDTVSELAERSAHHPRPGCRPLTQLRALHVPGQAELR